MNSTFKTLFLSVIVASLAMIVNLQFAAEPAYAHTKCRIDLGFGNWTEGCPHFHAPQGSDSHVGGPTGLAPTPRPTSRPGSNVYFKNDCYKPVRLALSYKNTNGIWEYKYWWNFDPWKHSYLASNAVRLRSNNSYFYYYAEATDGSGYKWTGEKRLNFNGATLPTRERKLTRDSDGDWVIRITCNNS